MPAWTAAVPARYRGVLWIVLAFGVALTALHFLDATGAVAGPALSIHRDLTTRRKHKLASILGVEDIATQNRTLLHHEQPKACGHRGSPYEEPENTMQSFKRALDHGVHGIELDVFRVKCGSLVVFHGEGTDDAAGGLEGIFGVPGSILDLTAEEARGLEFKGRALECPREKLRGVSMPLLEEVLQFVKDYDPTSRTMIRIELKGPRAEFAVVQLVERMDMVAQVTYISFHEEWLKRIRKLRPQMRADGSPWHRTGVIFSTLPEDFVRRARGAGATQIHLRYHDCTARHIEAIHEAGFGSACYFGGGKSMRRDLRTYHDVEDEDEEMYELVWRSGVQGVTVNHPGRWMKLMSDMESRSAREIAGVHRPI